MHPLQILKRPVITEKSTDLQDIGRYAFEVAPSATKHDIKRAVEETWGGPFTRHREPGVALTGEGI
jgi:large subunit ribosomal protein L23